jgi:hypothetical protein
VKEILTARAAGVPLRETLVKRITDAPTSIDSLYPIAEAINTFHPDLKASGIATKPTPLGKVDKGIIGDIVVVGVAERIAPIDENEPIRVQRRGGRKFPPPTDALNIFLRDDTDQLLCRIDRNAFAAIGQPVVERGRPGKALYALKGYVPKSFRMMMVQRVKYLGDLETRVGSADGKQSSPKKDFGEVDTHE